MSLITIKNPLKRTSSKDIVFHVINSFFMILVALITFYPFYFIVMNSVSNSTLAFGKFLFYPVGFNISAYKVLFESSDILNSLLISIMRSTIGPVMTIFIIFMTAYALSKKDLIGKKIITRLIVYTMYFSAGIIPLYILIVNLHLNNTFWVYIFPRLVNIFEMLLIKTYIEGIPDGLCESAYMDGANDLTVAFRIILPLCLPVIAAVGLFECVQQWNAYQDTLFFNAGNSDLHPIQYVLVTMIQSKAVTVEQAESMGGAAMMSSITLRMAMTVITIIPIAMVYPFLQKYFIKGLLVGSIKG